MLQKLLDRLMALTKIREQRKALEAFGRAHRFSTEGGLIINGLVVSELSYLLRYYSNNKVDRFDDFAALANDVVAIDGRIAADLLHPRTREQEAFGLDRATAEANLRNLRAVLQCICAYVALAQKHGLPATPSGLA